ncbi:DNA-directed RNA polymerase III subunit RPC8 [Diutina catenulata]
MYVLTLIEDLIRIPPSQFNIPIQHAITDELNKKYSNKVLAGVGLVVTVWDLLKIDDGLLKPGDGGSYVGVEFRAVVWKPFIGEVLIGWVAACTEEGIKVKLDFFDEIFIPKSYLFENCEYKETDKAWVWRPDDESELFIDINEKVRFRLEEEVFANIKPKSGYETEEEIENRPRPYVLIGSMQTEGMGCVSWWE